MESGFFIILGLLILAIAIVGIYIVYQHFIPAEAVITDDEGNPEIIEIIVTTPEKPPRLPE